MRQLVSEDQTDPSMDLDQTDTSTRRDPTVQNVVDPTDQTVEQIDPTEVPLSQQVSVSWCLVYKK